VHFPPARLLHLFPLASRPNPNPAPTPCSPVPLLLPQSLLSPRNPNPPCCSEPNARAREGRTEQGRRWFGRPQNPDPETLPRLPSPACLLLLSSRLTLNPETLDPETHSRSSRAREWERRRWVMVLMFVAAMAARWPVESCRAAAVAGQRRLWQWQDGSTVEQSRLWQGPTKADPKP
jgi:hypothetical protein